MCLEGNLIETREVGPTLVLDHVTADLMVVIHLKGEDGLLRCANPIAVSEHCVEFPHKDVPVGHDPRRWLLDEEVAEPVRGGTLEES